MTPCGSGSLLLRALAEASNPRVSIFGQEKDSSTAALAKLNMLLHGISARWIAEDLNVAQTVIDLSLMKHITHNALMDDTAEIQTASNGVPNTFVDGRNALFLLYAAIYAKSRNIKHIIAGVCETDFSGYPDCRDVFVKSMNVTLNLAMDYAFQIHTPLMYLTKAQTWALADRLGCLDYIREHTHTCYLGITGGCGECPSCVLRERGLAEYLASR